MGKAAYVAVSTSVQRMTFPLALHSDPWKILILVIDSMDFPSMGLMILYNGHNLLI